jgi:hypothetical protein
MGLTGDILLSQHFEPVLDDPSTVESSQMRQIPGKAQAAFDPKSGFLQKPLGLGSVLDWQLCNLYNLCSGKIWRYVYSGCVLDVCV